MKRSRSSLPVNRYHRRICEELSKLGIPYMEEYPVGGRDCDLYISDLNRIVEIDGPTHFRKADDRRDAELKAERPELDILHIKVGTPISEAMEVILEQC